MLEWTGITQNHCCSAIPAIVTNLNALLFCVLRNLFALPHMHISYIHIMIYVYTCTSRVRSMHDVPCPPC